MRENIFIIDLFSGAGGFSQGFHQASPNFKTLAAVEFNKQAAASYSATFPNVKVYNQDIKTWVEEEAIKYTDKVDVIIGGPPCQGFSTLGKQDDDDERNKLWKAYQKALSIIKPKYFVLENVSNFFKSKEFTNFKKTLKTEEKLKQYDFKELILTSADYGSPQKRKRAIIIGYRQDVPIVNEPIKTHSPDGSYGKVYRTVRDAFKNIPLAPDQDYIFASSNFINSDKTLRGPFKLRELHWSRNYSDTSLERFATIPYGGNRFDIPENLLSNCWKKHKNGAADVMGRLTWENPSVTIRTEFFKPEKGRYLHPTENRAITHYEAAILQGFPENHQFVGSKTEIAKQIGNAVPIQMGTAIARSILRNYND